MSERIKEPLPGILGKVVGALLVTLGVLFLVAGWFRFDVAHWTWPFFPMVPGVALLLLGIGTNDRLSHLLIVVGTMVTTVGLLLFFQNLTDHWASWAYAWTLVAPTALGVGKVLYGLSKGQPQSVTTGTRYVIIGLILFIAGAIFFELVIGISGFGLGGWVWPVVAIGLGASLLLRELMDSQRKV